MIHRKRLAALLNNLCRTTKQIWCGNIGLPGALLVAQLIFAVAFTPSLGLAVESTISQLLANPSSFDGQHVTVSGTAQYVRPKTSRKGNDYETFSLCEQGCVNVFTWGHPNIAEDKQVTVNGTFAAIKQVGRYTFHNEIEADEGSL